MANELGEIVEIRGIYSDQNLDPYIPKVVEEKLEKEFKDQAKKYQQKLADTKKLTELMEKMKKKEPFTKEELMFLYEVYVEEGGEIRFKKIKGFGYEPDPRIEELREYREKVRGIKKDLAFIFNCSEDEISLTKEEALKGGIKVHYGDLEFWGLNSPKGLKLPEVI